MNLLRTNLKFLNFRHLPGSFRICLSTSKAAQGGVAVKKKRVNDEIIQPFVPMQKLEFQKDGRCLLYYYQSKNYTNSYYYSKYFAAFFYIGYLIKHNPWFLTFPASLPIMFVIEAMVMKRIMSLMRNFRQSIREIYLHSDGMTLEIVYDTQFWRKFKKDDVNEYLNILSMKTPEKAPDMPPLSGDLFPEVFPMEKEKNMSYYAWTKYYGNPKNWIMLPKAYKYANMEVLVAAFRGIPIEISKRTVLPVDYVKKEKYI